MTKRKSQKVQLSNCCGTIQVRLGPIQELLRGRPPVRQRRRKVYHVRGEERFWHWYDQRKNLADGYG